MKVLWKSNPWGKAIGVAFVMFYQCVCCQLCVCVNFLIFIHNDKNGLIIQSFSNIQMEYLDRLFSKCACAKLFWRLTIQPSFSGSNGTNGYNFIEIDLN